MGLLTRVLSGGSAQASAGGVPNPWDDRWYDGVGPVSTAGVAVTPESAMTLSAVWAATRILAEGIASLPCLVYKRLDNGGKERAPGHPLYELLRWQPNTWQTAMEFWEMMMGHLVLRGNAYAQIIPGPRGAVDQLIPRHPDRVKVETIRMLDGTTRLRYIWTPPNGQPVTLTQDEMFHLRGLSSDGITGLSVIDAARNSLGMAMAAEKYGATFFSKGATVAAVLQHPKTITGPAQANLKKSIEEQMRNPHGLMVLEEGMTWNQIGMKVEDAQLVQLLGWGVHDVARYWNVPLHLLREIITPTYASIEMFDLELVIHTFRPWAVRIEQAIRRDLITGFDTYFVEFLMDALLRGDSASRASFYNAGITNGWMTRNEVRIKENLNPLPGLDEPLTPLNMTTGNNPSPASHPPPSRAAALAASSADRVLRRELGAVQKARKQCGDNDIDFREWAAVFYQDHVAFVSEALAIPALVAVHYCAQRQAQSRSMSQVTDTDRAALVSLALQEDERAA